MTPDFRARVVKSARAVAASYFRLPYRASTVASRRFAARVVRSPDGDLAFTDLAMRLDPTDSTAGPATDEELTRALEAVWPAVAAEFDPGVDSSC